VTVAEELLSGVSRAGKVIDLLEAELGCEIVTAITQVSWDLWGTVVHVYPHKSYEGTNILAHAAVLRIMTNSELPRRTSIVPSWESEGLSVYLHSWAQSDKHKDP